MADITRGFSLVLITAVFLVAGAGPAMTATSLPVPDGLINDFGALIGPSAERRLDQQVREFEARFGSELVIVTTTNRADRAYAQRLFEYWRVGKPGLNNGILLLVGNDGRSVITVGPRLRSFFSEYEITMIARDLRERVKAGKSGPGLARATAAIAGIMAMGADERGTQPYDPPAAARAVVAVFFASMAVLPWAAAVLARSRRVFSGTVMGLLIGALMTLFAGISIGAAIAAALGLIGLTMDLLVSRNYRVSQSSHTKPAWWAGGNWA